MQVIMWQGIVTQELPVFPLVKERGIPRGAF